jgi:cell division protein FtsB
MGNLSTREKAFIYVILLLLIIVAGYFLGIRNLNNQYNEYKTQLEQLTARKDYLDKLKLDIDATADEIKELDGLIEDKELSFIDKLDSECIEQYVMKTLEESGMPYMSSITCEDIACAPVNYPDGSAAPDSLQCLRVTIKYSTTDGYITPQYNLTPDFTGDDAGAIITALYIQQDESFAGPMVGYDEFIAALKKIAEENPDCIKIYEVNVIQNAGFLDLNASIDFYGTNLANRVSTDDRTDAYTFWQGDKNVDTAGGFIGFPYIVTDTNSLWYGIENPDEDCKMFIDRPFAAYWANAAYVLKIGAADGDLSVITGITPGSAAASGVSGAQGGEAEGGEGEELEAVGE